METIIFVLLYIGSVLLCRSAIMFGDRYDFWDGEPSTGLMVVVFIPILNTVVGIGTLLITTLLIFSEYYHKCKKRYANTARRFFKGK